MHSWPHAPARQAHTQGSFILTARVRDKARLFAGEERLRLLQSLLFQAADETGLRLEAWAVFAGHYPLVGHAEGGAFDVPRFARTLHGRSALALNRLDGVRGRSVWANFYDTSLTRTVPYLARLYYVHANPVRHGVVALAREYPFGSAHWFETQADEAWVRTVYSFPIDRVNVEDDF